MRITLWIVASLMAAGVLYVFVLRPRGRKWFHGSWYDHLCDKMDPIYAKLFGGSRTLFLARLVSFAGYAIGVHDVAAPILIEMSAAGLTWDQFFSPETSRTITLGGIVLGHAFAKLRTVTTGPVPYAPPPPPADADDVREGAAS